METINVKLIGTTPLLMHNPAGSMTQPGMKSPKQRIPSPEDEAEAGTYRNEDGYLVFPAIAIRSCILNAAIGYRIGRRSAKSILAGAILGVTSPDGDSEWLLVTDHNGTPLTDYKIDTRRAVIQGRGILRSRPKLEEWRMDAVIMYDERFVSEEAISEVLDRAGVIIGLGDFRPQKGGPFGRFRIEIEETRGG